MADWQVWRQDDNGQRFLVDSYAARVHALARVYVFEAGHPHKQLYEVVGDRRPGLRTNRDLYLALVGLGDHLSVTGRALLDYLCALWLVSRPLAVRDDLDGDEFAALLMAAATAMPVRPEPAWRVADYSADGPYRGFEDFTKVVCTQISDLLAFAEDPPGPLASLGVPPPPRIDGGRATVARWCNFDPPTFLECAAAGAFGGWNEADGRRVRTESQRDTESQRETESSRDPDAWSGEEVRPLEPISWGDVAAFLEYGQCYE